MPLHIHPRPSRSAAQYRPHTELTGAAWGFAPETAGHALRIVYSGVFDRHSGDDRAVPRITRRGWEAE
jgi:hypothetical protein